MPTTIFSEEVIRGVCIILGSCLIMVSIFGLAKFLSRP